MADANSQVVSLSGNFGIVFDQSEFGFGNFVAGTYFSEWEAVRLTTADDHATILPYWSLHPPAPMLTLATADPPHEVSSQINFSAGAYLVNDAAVFVLDTRSGDLHSTPITDPSAPPAQHIETFTGLAGGQTVIGWVEITDVSGRTTVGTSAGVEL